MCAVNEPTHTNTHTHRVHTTVQFLTLLHVSAVYRHYQGNVTQKNRLKLVNHLKPTGHVMHHQFNIQQLYALPTL